MERRKPSIHSVSSVYTTGLLLRRRETDHAPSALSEKSTLTPAIVTVTRSSLEAIKKIVHQLEIHQTELVMQNIELRRTQSKFEVARLRYFDLYNLAPVGYVTLSSHGLILEVNFMAAKILGCQVQALVKKPILNFIYRLDQNTYIKYLKLLFSTGEPQSYEIRIANNVEKFTWIEVIASSDRGADDTPLQRMVLTDISERKHAELMLRQSEERHTEEQNKIKNILKDSNMKLAKTTAVAERANRAKSDFLCSMSHELRTPLGAILGFTQLIESGNPSPTDSQQRSIDQILQAGWYLLDLINEILDFSSIESGNISITMEPVPLVEVLLDCQAMVEIEAKKHNISVNIQKCDPDHYVYADRIRLKQILINLVSNAIKYNRPGGSVTISFENNLTKGMRVYVKDNGQGMTPEQISQLFQPFNRLGKENGCEEGAGIGLVVTKRLIELMGGGMGLESIPNEGSVFWVDFPPA